MKKHVILIAVIILVCACAVGLAGCGKEANEPSTSDNGDVSDIVTDPTEEITEPITDKPTEPVTEPATEAPTEPATEAPTEPETEPETVPPTQPKVDFTYIARDTMLDGEEVEYYKGIYFENYGRLIDENLRVSSVVHNRNENDVDTTSNIEILIINTYEEYVNLCEMYYGMVVNKNDHPEIYLNIPKNWERLYDSYTQIPQYASYDRDYFKNNDLILLHSGGNIARITKNGAELCLNIGIALKQHGAIYPDVVQRSKFGCYEISKSDMDGIDTISVFVEKSGNI